jgi:hypothetical protein
VTLNDAANYEWTDGTTAALNLPWAVGKAQIAKPTLVAAAFTYDTTEKTVSLTASGLYALGGDTAKTNAGDYAATVTLNDAANYEWADGTTAALNLPWAIAKAKLTVAQPTYTGGTLTFGDSLPPPWLIATATTGGAIALDADQTLMAGTKPYAWTFTPDDTANYEIAMGTINLTVEKAGQNIEEGVALTAALSTTTSVALNDLGSLYEYSKDNLNWQNSNVFSGLAVDTPYTFYARLKATANHNESAPISVEKTTTPTAEDIFTTSGATLTGLAALGKTLTSITIPNSIGGTTITAIGSGAFQSNNILTEVTMPSTLTSIGGSAFAACGGLTDIVVPDSVTRIEYAAFAQCNALESITIPFVGLIPGNTQNTNFGYIFGASGYSAHSTGIPASLKTVIVTGKSGESIANSAFRNCTGLTTIILQDSVTGLGYYAFQDCTELRNVSLGKGLTMGYADWFKGCAKLENLTMPYTGVNYAGETFIGYIFGATAYANQNSYIPASLKTVTITAYYITSIRENAFYGCSGLTNIILASGVTSIAGSAFYNCSKLTNMVIPDTVTSIAANAFQGCGGLIGMTLPFAGASKTATGNDAKFGYIFGTASYTGGTATNQNGATYYIPTALRTVTVTGGAMGDYAFYNCSRLTGVTIGGAVTAIGAQTFQGCGALTSLSVPFIGASKTSGNAAKLGYLFGTASYTGGASTNQNGTTYYIPTTLKTVAVTNATTIAQDAFYACVNLTAVSLASGVMTIGSSAFYNCSNLASVTIPSGVNTIGASAFSGCPNLTVYTKEASKRTNWDTSWNASNRPVVWNCALETENGGVYVVSLTWNYDNFSYPAATNGIKAPYRVGYTFAGWAKSPGGAVVYTASNMYTDAGYNETIYSVWTAV